MESFIKKAKEVIRENEDLFLTLAEFDRYKTLRKARYKEKYTFTIDEALMNRFKSYCKKHSLKMSSQVEDFIKEFMNKADARKNI